MRSLARFAPPLAPVHAMACAFSCAVAAAPALAQEINGAGATFPAPLYQKWGEEAKSATGVTLNYQAIGSGGGQSQILARTVDFGASDAPVDAQKLQTGNLVQIPAVIGGVVVIVNLPGIADNQVKLSGHVLADIYEGDVKRWNDKAIAELNPGVKLPSTAISVVHRSDGSGTTYIFTSYLSAVEDEWSSKVGKSTSVNWPVGEGAKGNDGVTQSVKATPGAIGYVENTYAAANHLTTTQLQNQAGKFVSPSVAAFAAAAQNADWKGAQNFAVNLINQAGDTSWPIVSTTFLLVPKDPKNAQASAAVVKFIDWAYAHGDQAAESLQYIPLPQAVKSAAETELKSQVKG